MAYASLQQFELFGLRREVLTPRVRALAVIDPGTDTLGISGAHGWSGTEALQFQAQPMSGATPTLPAGLSATVVYRPLPVDDSDSLFQVSLTVGGAAVSFSDDGEGSIQVVEQLGPMISAYLEQWSGNVEEDLVAYAPFLPEPVPPIVTWVVCKLAAYDMAVVQSLVTPEYWARAKETVASQAEKADDIRKLWRAGKLLQRLVADATPDVVENGTAILLPDPGEWSSGGIN